MSEPRVVQKAFAYVTRGREVLVFLQPDFPEVGLQVPAGTVEPGESPERAVLREAHEETGLGPFSDGVFLGQREFDARLYGKPEIHERHFYHLVAPGSPPSRSRHLERHSGGIARSPSTSSGSPSSKRPRAFRTSTARCSASWPSASRASSELAQGGETAGASSTRLLERRLTAASGAGSIQARTSTSRAMKP